MNSKFTQHRAVILGIITCNVANLQLQGQHITYQTLDGTYTYLVLDAHSLDDLEESLSEVPPIVCVVQPRKADDHVLELPLGLLHLLHPVRSYSKVPID